MKKAIKAVPGVNAATVNLATERVSVRHRAGLASIEDIEAAIRGAGYEPHRIEGEASTDREREARERELADLRRATLLAAALTLPVFVIEMGSHLVPLIHDLVMHTIGTQTSWLIQFALTTIILFGPGRRFFEKGVPAMLRGTPDMNSLVVVGTSAAWAYSVVATFAPQVLPAGSIYYRRRCRPLICRPLSKRRPRAAPPGIKRLVGLQQARASSALDGRSATLDVRFGDIVQVRPAAGARRWQVVGGNSYVDESMTGMVPVAKGGRQGEARQQDRGLSFH